MRNMKDTIARLAAIRGLPGQVAGGADRLRELEDFGSNPGALRGRIYLPERVAEGAPLVVVLHGCTQDAAGYDRGSGWSQLADAHGFALLFPEQQRRNNANLCFNWFVPADAQRGGGEPVSIVQMIEAMALRHAIDRSRVYVTGLSAGGAMTAVMLATYPELFASGAIIAGLPYGTARSVPEAFDRMRGHGGPAGAALGALVDGASPHAGPWPTLSVWHGTSDATVSLGNADHIVTQWRAVHGLAEEPSVRETVDGHARRAWADRDGRVLIEEYRIAGMGHGTPLETGGDAPCGETAPFMLEAGISSTRHIARFWGLIGEPQRKSRAAAPVRERLRAVPTPPAAAPLAGVQAVIEDALRKAGLMR